MKKYDEYKDSGVEWIGEVPKHWEVIPLKFTGAFGNGLTYSPKDVVDNVSWYYVHLIFRIHPCPLRTMFT